jgi:hypothetical protein
MACLCFQHLVRQQLFRVAVVLVVDPPAFAFAFAVALVRLALDLVAAMVAAGLSDWAVAVDLVAAAVVADFAGMTESASAFVVVDPFPPPIVDVAAEVVAADLLQEALVDVVVVDDIVDDDSVLLAFVAVVAGADLAA